MDVCHVRATHDARAGFDRLFDLLHHSVSLSMAKRIVTKTPALRLTAANNRSKTAGGPSIHSPLTRQPIAHSHPIKNSQNRYIATLTPANIFKYFMSPSNWFIVANKRGARLYERPLCLDVFEPDIAWPNRIKIENGVRGPRPNIDISCSKGTSPCRMRHGSNTSFYYKDLKKVA